MANFKAYKQYDTNHINEIQDPMTKTLVPGGVEGSDPTGAKVIIQGSDIGINLGGNLTGHPTGITQYTSQGDAYFGFTNLNVDINSDVYDTGYHIDGQTLYGFQAETASWLHGDDHVVGSEFSDVLSGFAGNDVLQGLGGNDILNGYSGKDTAEFSGNASQYTTTVNGSQVIVQSGSEGTDTLNNVELLKFADQTMSIAQVASAQDQSAVFRFYNSAAGTHFYTASAAEADSVVRNLDGFTYEGVSFDKSGAGATDSIDVFRFYNTETGTHFYTGSRAEADSVMANLPNFRFEGTAYQAHSSNSEGTTELYRFYNTETGTHFYTANEAEMNSVRVNLSGTYNYEGVAYYVDVA